MNSKTAVITGSSRGIGKAIAIAFAKNNYNVVINYKKSENEAKKLKEALLKEGYSCEIFKADVSDFVQANSLIDFAVSTYGKIDTLINNAGISQIKLFTDITKKDWETMLNTNLSSIFNCTQPAVKNMLHYKSGSIINISSMWGICGASCEVHYSAVKAGVIGFTKALAKELAPSGIRVNCISPGVIMTDMMGDFSEEDLKLIKEDIPLGSFGTPSDIANLALFLADDKAKNITGQNISSNGGQVI